MAFSIVELNPGNLCSEDIVCLRGKKDAPYIELKKNWMKKEFSKGLKFKKLIIEGRSWGFIEYMPGENSWRPVEAEGYNVIHCHWVIGRHTNKGFRQLLLDVCIEDSKKGKGVAVVVENKPKSPKYRFYSRRGFEVVDEADGFVLMVYRNGNAAKPEFCRSTKKRNEFDGIYISYMEQCPYIGKSIIEMENTLEKYGVPHKTEKLENTESVRNSVCPFGVCGIYYKGEFLTHEPLYESKFVKILSKNGII